MTIKMMVTEQFFTNTEEEAEGLVANAKNPSDGELVDYKVTQKETKDGAYFVVTIKTRFATLADCKESIA